MGGKRANAASARGQRPSQPAGAVSATLVVGGSVVALAAAGVGLLYGSPGLAPQGWGVVELPPPTAAECSRAKRQADTSTLIRCLELHRERLRGCGVFVE